ncbi:hypothetical protein AAVH_24190 [Aphelenchoides avenae]|nr:hypothetical protein AAVH_24190 [Aphelenchus avenae]
MMLCNCICTDLQAVGGGLSEQQIEKKFTTIRDRRPCIEREVTLTAIKRYYETHQIDVTKVSLMWPAPVRSSNCRLNECIDLRSYLEFHKQLTFWECPFSFCKVQARCDSLRVDEYMSVVIQDIVKEVEVFAGGSFHAVRPPTPAMQEIVDDEHLCIPASNTAPIVKTEVNNENLGEPMETEAFRMDGDQAQASSLAEGGEEQLHDALNESRQQNAALRCDLASEKNRADTAESDASKLRDENYRLLKDLATKVHENRELTAKNEELQARLNALRTAAEAILQMNQYAIESGSSPINEDPHEPFSSPPAEDTANEVAEAATDSGTSAHGESQLEHDGGSVSDASMSEHSDSSATESDSDAKEEPSHAPKQHKKQDGIISERTFGERPYQCANCDKQAGRLRRHERVHVKP